MNEVIRILGATDADEFRRVRLDALRLHPEAFSSSYEDEASLDRAQIVERLETPGLTRFGAFAQASMVGLVGLQMPGGTKVRHKARLFSMYVEATSRRSGLAQQLVQAVIDRARQGGAVVLQLSVTVGNLPAQRLYDCMGFRIYGTESRSLKIGDRFYDEHLMALDLDRSGHAIG